MGEDKAVGNGVLLMKALLIYLSCVLLITSCGGGRTAIKTPTINSTSTVSHQTSTPIKTGPSTLVALFTATQRPTITPNVTATITPTSTEPGFPSPVPNSTVTQHCLEINDQLLPKSNLEGTLVLGNGLPDVRPYLLDLNTNKRIDYSFTTQNPQLWLDYAAVSPDGKWLAYIEWFTKANISRLHLISSDLLERPYLDLPTGWGKIVYWLDNQRILLSTSQTLPEGIYPSGKMMILYPFLREWEILSPKLPFQISTDPMHWFYSPDNPIVIYNPSLTQAVYLALSGFYLIDAKSLNIITHISTINYMSRPQWSPQGDRFAMVIDNAQYPDAKSEIYQFNQEGQSKSITSIARAFGDNNESIVSFKWSPDGSKIAFTYFLMDFHDAHLAVVDVGTGQTVDYCVPSLGLLPPIWSPDSNKIAFASGRSTDEERIWRTVILDLENEYAIQVADTMLPLGWMKNP